MNGPQNEYCQAIHAEKHRGRFETFDEALGVRLPTAMSDSKEHLGALQQIFLGQRFLPAGRIQSAVGSTRHVTAFNCFVSGTIEDSMDSIMLRATEAVATMRRGGGIGYDFSRLRPRGHRIVTLDSTSSGPVSFMHIFDAACYTIMSAGHRRGAMMGVLRIDHPDIEEFIRAKQNLGKLEHFNISVAITEAFMQALERGEKFPLVFEGKTDREVDARALWDELMLANWNYAEPGVLFIDRINDENNLAYCERIEATNPCGEQPLPPYGACLLGSFNLVKYLAPDQRFNWGLFMSDTPHVVRAMDNVIDRTIYPLSQQEKEAKKKRRMGLGVTGLANAGEWLGHPYGSPEFIRWERKVLRVLRDTAYESSVTIAREKGPFPAFDKVKYPASPFIQRLPEELQADIKKHGIRNSHLLSIAPAGTISLTADNVSSGIEPVFLYEVDRAIKSESGDRVVRLPDYGWKNLGVKGRTVDDLRPEEHLAVMLAAVPYIDSAISKTINVGPAVTWEEFKEIYIRAWKGGAKGCTTFREAGQRPGVITRPVDAGTCTFDPATGAKDCD